MVNGTYNKVPYTVYKRMKAFNMQSIWPIFRTKRKCKESLNIALTCKKLKVLRKKLLAILISTDLHV